VKWKKRVIVPLLAAGALVFVIACGAGQHPPSGVATTSSSSGVITSSGTPPSATAGTWHPQAIPDSAMPSPNQPPRSFGSPQALASAIGCGDASQRLSRSSGEQDWTCLFTGSRVPTQIQDDDLQIEWFSSPAAEQQFGASVAQTTTSGAANGAGYTLFGNGWVVGPVLEGYVQDVKYPQSVIGGSLVYYSGGVVEPYQPPQ
jgi:hypothetical protein